MLGATSGGWLATALVGVVSADRASGLGRRRDDLRLALFGVGETLLSAGDSMREWAGALAVFCSGSTLTRLESATSRTVLAARFTLTRLAMG